MRQFTVTLSGKTLDLKYRLDDREAVEALFPRADGTPAGLSALVSEHLIKNGGSFKVQTALLWGALAHLPGDAWTIERVKEEFGKLMVAGGGVRNVNTAVFNAIISSGVLGVVVDPDAGNADKDAGKEQAPAA